MFESDIQQLLQLLDQYGCGPVDYQLGQMARDLAEAIREDEARGQAVED